MQDSKLNAFVTGAAQGIGRAIANSLQQQGYNVTASDVCERPLDLNKSMDYIKCDISNSTDRIRAAEYMQSRGGTNLLVNNAGVACLNRLDILETTEESFDRLIAINTKGTFFMCREFSIKMIESKSANYQFQARIINIGSISAYTSSPSRGEYCISKAATSMTTKLFADRLAEYNIPVFEIRPGIIKTPMTDTVSKKYDKMIAEGITPVKRWGQPEDVANCVLAAAQGYLDFGTGTVLNADGGFHLRRL